LISLIIPTFNEEKILGRCLRSIEAQNYHDYEVVIVDGRSSDKTLDIAECYKHKILMLPRERPHDVSLARNFGASPSRYSCFLPSMTTGQALKWSNS